MMKKYLLTLLMLLVSLRFAVAEEFWYGYGDGQNLGKTSVGSSATATLTAAIKIPASQTNNFIGCRITRLQFAVTKKVGTAQWFISTALGDAAQMVSIDGGLTVGWHEVELAEPYVITEACDLYLGYTTKGVSLTIPLLAGNGSEGSCIIGTNKNYQDYYVDRNQDYSLPIRALIVSDSEIAAGLGLSGLTDLMVGAECPYEVSGQVVSTSDAAVTSWTMNLSLDGEVVDTQDFTADLQAKGATAPFSLTLPALPVGNYEYGVEVCAINGQPIAEPYRQTSRVEVRNIYLRRHVVEEGTGTWCGWCPMGIVAFRQMRQRYPDRFIGIAVHARNGNASFNDEYQIDDYLPFINAVPGFPYARLNRTTAIEQPDPEHVERAFHLMPMFGSSQVLIDEARFTDASCSTIRIRTTCRFAEEALGDQYRLAFALLEDSVQSLQQNYFSGGANGPMGGFESEPAILKVSLMDVARALYSYEGIAGSVPTQLEANVPYLYEYELPVPANVLDASHLSVVALLQNAYGTEIFNADQCHNILRYDGSGIESVICDPQTHGAYDSEEFGADGSDAFDTCGSRLTGSCYDLQGRRLAVPQQGTVYLEGGRLRLQR